MITSERYSAAVGSDIWAAVTISRIISSLKREAIRAAQNASASSIWSNAGCGYSVFQFHGWKKSASTLPSDGLVGYFTLIQGRIHKPNDSSPSAILSFSIRYS